MKGLMALLIILCTGKSHNAQSLNGDLVPVDTVSMYNGTWSILNLGGVKSYSVAGRPATEEQFKKYTKGHQKSKDCNPCYLKIKDNKERLVKSGPYYGRCPGSKPMQQPNDSVYSGDKHYVIKGNSCNHGKWKYYDTLGNVIEEKTFEYGKQIQPPVPEQENQ